MLVTVIVCTWNRAGLLARTLGRMRGLTVPSDCEWELLVVDNASTDATAEVLAGLAGRLPLRVEREPVLGLARARNRAVVAARGSLLLFTDDDTFVDAGWLAAYAGAAARFPEAVYFGGRIDPLFERPPARWLTANAKAFRPMLCVVDAGAEERPIGVEKQPFGPNMAFRRAAFADLRFDERLGRRGREQVRGSEVALVEELRRRGRRGVWIPSARVEHLVPPERASLAYVWRYHHGAGRALARLHPEEVSLGGAALGVCRGVAGTVLKGLAGRPDWVVHLGRTAHFAGRGRERVWGRSAAA
jgi:glycosyltransferase involved in cell wall biosynthesis